METVKRLGDSRGLWRGKMNRQSTEDFGESQNSLCDIIVMDISHTFVQTNKIYNSKN